MAFEQKRQDDPNKARREFVAELKASEARQREFLSKSENRKAIEAANKARGESAKARGKDAEEQEVPPKPMILDTTGSTRIDYAGTTGTSPFKEAQRPQGMKGEGGAAAGGMDRLEKTMTEMLGLMREMKKDTGLILAGIIAMARNMATSNGGIEDSTLE